MLEIIRLINDLQINLIRDFTFLHDKKKVIFDAEAVKDNENFLAIPGQVTNILKSQFTYHLAMGKSK